MCVERRAAAGRSDTKLITPFRFSLTEMSVCLTYLKPPLSNSTEIRPRDRQTTQVRVERSTLWRASHNGRKVSSTWLESKKQATQCLNSSCSRCQVWAGTAQEEPAVQQSLEPRCVAKQAIIESCRNVL